MARELARKVTYIRARLEPEVHPKRGSWTIDETVEERLLLTKSREWCYERERRMLVELRSAQKHGDLYFRPFDRRLQLAEVILGPLCDLPLAGVRDLVRARYPNATVFESRPADKWFSIVPEEETVLRIDAIA